MRARRETASSQHTAKGCEGGEERDRAGHGGLSCPSFLPFLFPQALPAAGIRIFASQLHTHLAGRKVVTVLARDGRERQVVNADRHYSPHFQVQGLRGRWVSPLGTVALL